ncbi:MAG: hypothetical protein M1823_003398 [Watsoniomyces obsoletus]|nr:MAG: hypothetical protein M1823_003398 [Watsoniomyces obsoletus]
MALLEGPWGSHPAARLGLVMLALMMAVFLVKLYQARRHIRSLRAQGLAMPPHNPIFGHLLLIARIAMKLPRHAHGHYLGDLIRRRYPELGTAFYLDLWPFTPTVLVVISPTLAAQFTQERLLPKHPGLRRFFGPLTGKQDLLSMEGPAWKIWRGIFNPGFSTTHLMTLVPAIMKDVSIFCEQLQEHARRSDVFSLEEMTLNVTIDVIGRVALDAELDTQRTYNDMTAALRDQIGWCIFGLEPNPLTRFNPLRPIVHWYNNQRMNRYVKRELEDRYARRSDTSKSKSIVDLALKAYTAENVTDQTTSKHMDPTFQEFAISQIKLFIFAGHDTTASTICYVYHLLSQDPVALQRVRDEYDNVFGRDLSRTSSMITSQPHLLNQLPYTLAIIKETLRLYPVVNAPRAGQPDFFLTDDTTGHRYPTENCIVWLNHHALHRNPNFWIRPNEFVPERWLVGSDDPLHPVRNAWRPFELGPRNCIGKELAMLEVKMIMALTLRELDVKGAYEEWDRMKGRGKGGRNVNGERAYQIQLGTAHPSDGFPCRVGFAKRRDGKKDDESIAQSTTTGFETVRSKPYERPENRKPE